MLYYWLVSIFLDLAGLEFNPYLTFSLWILINCLDIHSTHLFMKYGGKEGNPIFKFLFEKIGFTKSTIMLKVTLALILGWLFMEKNGPNRVIMAWNIVFVCVVIGNYLHGLKLKYNPPQ